MERASRLSAEACREAVLIICREQLHQQMRELENNLRFGVAEEEVTNVGSHVK